MKKLLFLVLAGCTSSAFAQKSFFGVDAGINVANQRAVSQVISNGTTVINDVVFQFNKVAPTFGLFYHFGLSETTGIRVGGPVYGIRI